MIGVASKSNSNLISRDISSAPLLCHQQKQKYVIFPNLPNKQKEKIIFFWVHLNNFCDFKDNLYQHSNVGETFILFLVPLLVVVWNFPSPVIFFAWHRDDMMYHTVLWNLLVKPNVHPLFIFFMFVCVTDSRRPSTGVANREIGRLCQLCRLFWPIVPSFVPIGIAHCAPILFPDFGHCANPSGFPVWAGPVSLPAGVINCHWNRWAGLWWSWRCQPSDVWRFTVYTLQQSFKCKHLKIDCKMFYIWLFLQSIECQPSQVMFYILYFTTTKWQSWNQWDKWWSRLSSGVVYGRVPTPVKTYIFFEKWQCAKIQRSELIAITKLLFYKQCTQITLCKKTNRQTNTCKTIYFLWEMQSSCMTLCKTTYRQTNTFKMIHFLWKVQCAHLKLCSSVQCNAV